MKFLFLGVPASPSAPSELGLPAPAGGQTACGPLRAPDALTAALRPLLDRDSFLAYNKIIERRQKQASKQASKQYLYVTNQKNPHSVTKDGVFPKGKCRLFLYSHKFIKKMEERTMQKKNAGIARNFALKGLLLLAALTLSTGFFACEVPSVTLTFDAGEGSFKEGKTLALTGKAGENLALPETPVREGYDLAGWNPALPEKYPEKNTEYTAVWVKEWDYIITYVNVDGATNENPAGYNVETETITLKDPVKPGYTFGGWYKDGEFTTKVTEIIQGTTGNITLYAKWEPVSYTITYELDGGTNASENPAGYNVETETITLKDPAKAGYTFEGWYRTEDFTGNAVTEIVQGATGNITLYAKWEQIPFTTVKVEGGSCTLNGKKVTLSSFWISPYEVTQEEFESVMTGNQNGIEANPSYFQGDTKPPAAGEVQERRPVERVSWYDAIVYCNLLSIKEGLTPCYTIKGSTDPALWGTSPTSNDADWDGITCNFNADGYRLPTEAEWEYAARGGKAGITDGSWEYEYSGSNTIDEVAWYRDNSGSKTHEVGKKQANALGLYDMSGNVIEWCWDWYGSGYPGGTEDLAGPDTGSDRVTRGGCWVNSASICSVSYRYGNSPCRRNNSHGFRLVRSAR